MTDQSASDETRPEALYPDELIHVVGHVVMPAALVEDKAGELVMLASTLGGNIELVPVPGWAASGTALLKKLRAVAPEHLVDRLEAALAQRNYVVHGAGVPGKVFLPPGTDATRVWAFMKRELGTEVPARFGVRGWSIEQLDALARELSVIEDGLDDEVSYAMGLKTRQTARQPERPPCAQPQLGSPSTAGEAATHVTDSRPKTTVVSPAVATVFPGTGTCVTGIAARRTPEATCSKLHPLTRTVVCNEIGDTWKFCTTTRTSRRCARTNERCVRSASTSPRSFR